MRSIRDLLIGLVLLSHALVASAEDKALRLHIPQIEGDALSAFDLKMFSEIVDGFGVKIPAATVTTIVKEPGWTPNELILICSEKNGRSWVLVRRTQDEQKQKQIIVRFEDDLAARLNTVITYELLRSEGSPHRRPAFDTDSYLFSQTERPALIGETGGDNKNSTVGYLCHVADLISEYCHSDAGEHTRLLGEIDRAVTAIEIAYRKVK